MQQETKVTIEEMNRVIAEFIGGEYRTPKKYRAYFRFYSKDDFIEREATIDKLNYESDWRYLMPVVEKIEAIPGFHVGIDGYYNSETDNIWTSVLIIPYIKPCHTNTAIVDVCRHKKIEATHQAVYEFIIWYNKTQNQ